jgi:hypothetical protein
MVPAMPTSASVQPNVQMSIGSQYKGVTIVTKGLLNDGENFFCLDGLTRGNFQFF